MVGQATQTRAIILAGVHLWEESAFDNATPRPLLPVGGQPLICHVLDWLRRGSIRQATICANSTSRFIRRCLGDGRTLGIELTYYEDWTPRGPAGCAYDAALGDPADHYVVVDGTILPQVDVAGLLAQHDRDRADLTIAVCADSNVPDRHVGRLAPAGIYVFSHEALACTGPVGYQDIKEVLIPRLHADRRRIGTFLADGPCPRVSGLGSYLAVNEWYLDRLAGQTDTPADCRAVGEARIHRTARVDPQARLIGPVLVGAHSRVGGGVTIVGPCVIGNHCNIDGGAIVCRSVAWDFCRVGRSATVDHCVLTHQADVQAGARLYEKVQLPPPQPIHLLGHLRFWTAAKAAAREAPMPAGRQPALPLQAAGTRRVARRALRAPQKQPVDVPVG